MAYGEAMVVATVGLGVNLVCALVLARAGGHGHAHHDHAHDGHDHGHDPAHGHGDHNFAAAYVHVVADAFTSAHLLVGGTPEEHFWSETWTSLDALLTEVTGLLRAARPARFVDVDDGFRAGRDVSLGVGRWGWLDVRTLLEEHGGTRCLLRVGLRLRPAAVRRR